MNSFLRNYKVSLPVIAGVLALLAWLAFGFFGIHTLFFDETVDEAGPVFDVSTEATAPDTVDVPPVSNASDAPADEIDPTPIVEEPTTAPAEVAVDEEPVAPPVQETAQEQPTTAPEPVETEPEPAEPETVEPEPSEPVATDPIVEASGTFVDGVHPTSGAAVVLGNGTGQRFLRFEEFATDNGPDLSVYLVNSSAGGVNDFIDLGDLKGNIGDQNYEIPEGVDLSVYDRVEIWCVRFAVGFGNATLSAS